MCKKGSKNMGKKNTQRILTIIIVLAVIVLFILIGSIIYEEQMKKNKEAVESVYAPILENDSDSIEPVQIENTEIEEEIKNEEYIGEEEQETNEKDTVSQIQNNDEKAIDLARKEWGEDSSVTFNIEEKDGTKYYVAVKQDATVIGWYEIDADNWKIKEF